QEIVGTSVVMEELRQQIAIAAPTNGRVLIHGENGAGKELVARAVHARSARAEGPFVEVNCAAIPEELIESELFGHERGAFTGALTRRRGKFEAADSGTLFLDEIGDMSVKTQAKVLRALEEQVVERVGGRERLMVERLVIMVPGDTIGAEDLPPPLRAKAEAVPVADGKPLKEARDSFERAYILAELRAQDWNMTRTAERLGIERSHLYRKIRAYG